MKVENKDSNVGMQGGDNYGTVNNHYYGKLSSILNFKVYTSIISIIAVCAFFYNISTTKHKGEDSLKTTVKNEGLGDYLSSVVIVPKDEIKESVLVGAADFKKLQQPLTSVKNSISKNESLSSFLKSFVSKESLYSFLDIKLKKHSISHDQEKGDFSLRVDYEISVNYPLFEKKTNELERLLIDSGAVLESRTDYPKFNTPASKKGNTYLYSSVGSEKVSDNSVFLIKKKGESYIRDTWVLPESIEVKVPKIELLNGVDDVFINTMNIEVLTKDDGVIHGENFKISIFRIFPIDPQGNSYQFSNNFYWYHRTIGFAPFFSNDKVNFYSERNESKFIKIDNDDVEKIDRVLLQYKK